MTAIKSELRSDGSVSVSPGSMLKWAAGVMAGWVTIGGFASFVLLVNLREGQALQQQEQTIISRDINDMKDEQVLQGRGIQAIKLEQLSQSKDLEAVSRGVKSVKSRVADIENGKNK